ncbi:hypothetical protein [Methanobrevibacter filiformis]|uniref:Uncharacterized protein n=1 Tax=Methanobrevibacter filiformis TaxID=55758 RepID=A0A166F1Q5_9EURY|nr:hypothetical protein [Methanobrevibacter filiformis]KZX17230.1 hypothetical protein MBFIL_02630 [Methanobrevibacter filiformis]
MNVKIYNTDGTKRVVIEEEILYLDNRVGPTYHQTLEEITGMTLKCRYIDNSDFKCECCGSDSFKIHDYGLRNLNKNQKIESTIYKCRKCGKTHQTPLEPFVDKNSNYTNKVQSLGIMVNYLSHLSLNNISLLNGIVNNAFPSRQSTLNYP